MTEKGQLLPNGRKINYGYEKDSLRSTYPRI